MNESRGKVLIVDDDAGIRFVLVEALRDWGYEVAEAVDAVSARAVFVGFNPIAVLTDINLPDGSGLDLLREFKQSRPQTVVIVLTGEVIVENAISALRGNADDFISKPISIGELQLALNSNLAARQSSTASLATEVLRILIVTDSEERLRTIRTGLNHGEVEVAEALTQEDLRRRCNLEHDLAIVDLAPSELEAALQTLRENEQSADILVLVSAERILGGTGLAGLLPKYRAMACSLAEIAQLIRRRTQARKELAPIR